MYDNLPLISVIIPYFECEDYIQDALDSVLAQTYPNVEIIVVNDGSSAQSTEFIEHLLKQYPSVRYVYQENRGLSGARNHGAKIANGIFFLFLDADDKIEPTYLHQTATALMANDGAKSGMDFATVCGP